MKILFIAPVPPPITGHSLVSDVLYKHLLQKHDVKLVNLSKESLNDGVDSFKRIVQVISLLREVYSKNKKVDAIYLTISESLAGNFKDLLIYLLCVKHVSKIYIHLHGGSIKKCLWDKHPINYRLNRFFIKKIGGVIISGVSHKEIFENSIDARKVHIVPNFANDHMFIEVGKIKDKFLKFTELRVVYISNFIKKKGYRELADAFFLLSQGEQSKVRIDFAGKFPSEADKEAFLSLISASKQLKYHGVIDEQEKSRLFSEAHIFCLPTSFFEGQPVSILEAYASGCVVMTTGQSGIRDIFTPEQNGYEIEPTATSIKCELQRILQQIDPLMDIALLNHRIANKKYRIISYNKNIHDIITANK